MIHKNARPTKYDEKLGNKEPGEGENKPKGLANGKERKIRKVLVNFKDMKQKRQERLKN